MNHSPCKLLGVTLSLILLTACHPSTHAYDERATAMKPIFVPNSQAVDVFKKKINYPKIITHISNDQKLLLNWEQYIRQSDFGTGQSWQPISVSQWQEHRSMATLSVLMTHEQKNLDIQVQLVSNKGNAEAVEFAIESLGVTSHTDIMMDLDINGPCDVTLYGEPLPGIAGGSALCVLKNSILRITASEPGPDIRSVLTHFVQPLKKGYVDTPQAPIVPINLSTIKAINVGDVFFLDANVTKDDKTSLIETSDNIENLAEDEHRFTFKAISSGQASITIGVMNTKTLYVNAAEWQGKIDAP